jgi:hypothetical protein
MKEIKKHLFSAIVLGFFILIAFGSEDDYNPKGKNETEKTNEEKNQALIKSCKSIDGIVDASINEDILTIRAFISKKEGQKLSVGMLKEIKKYDLNINTVLVLDLDYNMVGQAEK